MKQGNSMSRRRFFKATGRVAAVATVASRTPAVLGAKSANETIGVGCIGLGVRGGTLIRQVAGSKSGEKYPGIANAKVVAVCDVYKPHLQKGVERSNNPSVRTYLDYQELLADKAVDAVIIAAPDHWHSKMLIDAANAKKDVYIEKGWTRTIAEAKAMREAVKKNGIVMQLGHQGREKAAGVQAAQLIKEGLLGPVNLVRVGRYTNRPRAYAVWRWYGGYNEWERP
ncbi:Gfo/Idh/MocA family oxidoreductase, partial [Candidatus Sumerlaeota bacterium]|nr:Gfo/Idh/MocA family oxidoreductase [Candidatus Sumerlaeota bacterium]